MKILVANLGSTSFKFRLFDMDTETQLARGGIDRIGGELSSCTIEIGDHRDEFTQTVSDHPAAVSLCFDRLTATGSGCLNSVKDVAAIGFKTVFAGKLSGVRLVDEELLIAMEDLADIAPAHNPPYVTAMRSLQQAFPNMPLVAALETHFHETIPEYLRTYAVPHNWAADYEVQRWGFHGASHRYIAGRSAELTGRKNIKVISCHLGGSNSICAIDNGASKAASMGMSPQTGLPHNNRVGDFDPYALPVVMRKTGKSLEQLLQELGNQSGLLGLSGLSGDVRDLEEAAASGHAGATLALNHFVGAIRHYVGAYLAILGGAEALVFTGGIGENSVRVRQEVCEKMEWAGLELNTKLNAKASGESRISTDTSRIEVWTIPTNEEIVVARLAAGILS